MCMQIRIVFLLYFSLTRKVYERVHMPVYSLTLLLFRLFHYYKHKESEVIKVNSI